MHPTLLASGYGYELYLHPDIPCLENRFTGEYQNSEEFRAHMYRVMHVYLEQLPQYPGLQYVLNVQKAKPMPDEEAAWVADVLLPRAMEVGMQGMVTVLAEDVFTQMVVESFDDIAVSQFGFFNHNVGSLAEALSWLRQRKPA